MELMTFVREHRSWFGWGAYDRSRNSFPMWLTPAGRSALRSHPDRLQMVYGGLVEPGFKVMPIDFHRDLNEQRSRIRGRAGLSRPRHIRPLAEKIEYVPPPKRRRSRRAA
jgi:hypothetical protein